MIKIHKRVDQDNGSRHECETVEDAHALFDSESAIVIVRCSSDEEYLGLVSSVLCKSRLAAEKGLLDTVMIWTPTMRQVDGDGWRLVFEQQETLTAKGVAKQQAQQQAQMQAAQAQMARMMGGGGGMPNGMVGKRR